MTTSPAEHSSDNAVRLGHQPETGHRLALSLTGIGFAVIFGASLGTAALVVAVDATDQKATGSPVFPKPGVAPNQQLDRRRVEAEQRESLRSYRWSDREAGVAAIPIERAMQLMTAERLAGSRPTQAGSPAATEDDAADGDAVAPQPD